MIFIFQIKNPQCSSLLIAAGSQHGRPFPLANTLPDTSGNNSSKQAVPATALGQTVPVPKLTLCLRGGQHLTLSRATARRTKQKKRRNPMILGVVPVVIITWLLHSQGNFLGQGAVYTSPAETPWPENTPIPAKQWLSST